MSIYSIKIVKIALNKEAALSFALPAHYLCTVNFFINLFLIQAIMRNINEIIIHCSATPASRDIGAPEIAYYHRHIGFETIGYHYVVRLDGTVEPGRPLTRIGAHCKGHNANSIGVCYVGGINADGLPADTRTEDQKWALRKLLISLKSQFPGAVIHSHRDFAPKACPCFDATAEYASIA